MTHKRLSKRLPLLENMAKMNETKATDADKAAKLLEKGTEVVITGGNPKFVGHKATVKEVYDASKGDKPAYTLTMKDGKEMLYDYDQVKSKAEVNSMEIDE